MKIYKTKNGLYGIDYTDELGKRHRTIAGTTVSAAQAQLAQKKAAYYAAKSNPKIAQENQVFKDLAHLFIKNHIALRPSKRAYTAMFNKILAHFAKYRLKEMTPLEVQSYYHQVAADTSYANANRHLGIISKFFTCMQDWEKYPGPNPCSKVKKRKDEPFLPNPLNEQEIKQLLPCLAEYIRPCIIFGFYTGLRRQELLGLRWENIDFTKQTIFIPKTKTENERTLGLTPDLIQLLENLSPRKEGIVFEKITADQLKYQLTHASIKAGLKHVRPHDMRHSFAVNFLNRGGKLEYLQRLMGHSNIKTTQRYMQFKKGEIASQMMVMDGLIPIAPKT